MGELLRLILLIIYAIINVHEEGDYLDVWQSGLGFSKEISHACG